MVPVAKVLGPLFYLQQESIDIVFTSVCTSRIVHMTLQTH